MLVQNGIQEPLKNQGSWRFMMVYYHNAVMEYHVKLNRGPGVQVRYRISS